MKWTVDAWCYLYVQHRFVNTSLLSPSVVCCPAKKSTNSSLSPLSLPRIHKSGVCTREFIVYANICTTPKWTLSAKISLREYIYPYSTFVKIQDTLCTKVWHKDGQTKGWSEKPVVPYSFDGGLIQLTKEVKYDFISTKTSYCRTNSVILDQPFSLFCDGIFY